MRKSRMVVLGRLFVIAALGASVAATSGCATGRRDDGGLYEVTGYCSCGKCCGWTRNRFGVPVFKSGPNKGKPKKVGVTASGVRAHHGTVAADPRIFGFGSVLDIPGYGRGVVEDVGSAINGRHLDLWFPTHEAALKWGRKRLKVRVVKRK